MSAMFAFEEGEAFMRSVTFEQVMADLHGRSTDPVDRQVCTDALEVNCLWVDQIPEPRKHAVLSGLRSVLEGQLASGVYAGNDTALFEIRWLLDELAKRYPAAERSARPANDGEPITMRSGLPRDLDS